MYIVNGRSQNGFAHTHTHITIEYWIPLMRVVFLLSQRPGFTADGAAELTTSSGSAPSSSAFDILEQPMSKLVSTLSITMEGTYYTTHKVF